MLSSTENPIICAVEIGTSKVVALLGEITGERSLRIVGAGKVASRGVSKGVVVDLKSASECAHDAIARAESAAGAKSEGVFLALSGGHVGGFENVAEVSVAASSGVVHRDDIQTVTSVAKQKRPPADHTVVHYVRRGFRLDGNSVENPEHLKGHRLSVSYWIVHGRTNIISDQIRIINGFNLRVSDVVLSSLASAVMTTTPEERRHGVLVVDIGCGTTDYALYRDGAVQMTGVIPVGGDHVSNDLSLALRVSLQQAETLKLRHGKAICQCKDRAERVWLEGGRTIGDRQYSLQAVEKVISVRVEEIFQILRKKLGAHFQPEAARAGCVLTGGASQLPHLAEVAERALGVPCRLADYGDGIWSEVESELRGPEFATPLGVLHYGLLYPGERAPSRRSRTFFSGLMEKLRLS